MRRYIFIFGLVALGVVIVTGCAQSEPTPTPTATFTAVPTPTLTPTPFVPPVPPIEPEPGPLTTPGYVYDDKLGYGFEYPGGWEMQIPEVVDGEDVESILMFTKPGTPTTLIVTVRLSDLTTLEEIKVEFREAVEKLGATISEQTEITASGREGYEVIYSPFPSIKMRQVMFIANGKSYMLVCSTTEQLYDEYEETFDSVISSFNIK